jgi:hypothetical protein
MRYDIRIKRLPKKQIENLEKDIKKIIRRLSKK